jgi:hypothetical protein
MAAPAIAEIEVCLFETWVLATNSQMGTQRRNQLRLSSDGEKRNAENDMAALA